MDLIAKALHGQPIDNLEDVSEGTVIQAICEDGQSRIGVYIQGSDGTPRLLPLNMEIPLTRPRKPRKPRQEGI